MATQEKISLYNMADLKNTTDDAVPGYLNSLKFKQSNYYLDVRLALGYGSFLVAAACFLWDYKLGWDKTKTWTQVAVIVYAGLSYMLSNWTQNVEKGAIYRATAPSGEEILISTTVDKFIPKYKVNVLIADPKAVQQAKKNNSKEPPKPLEIAFERPFNQWFDETGRLVPLPLQEAFATEVPLIGRLDPKRVKTASGDMLAANPELLDAIAQASGADASAGASKGGKRRKN